MFNDSTFQELKARSSLYSDFYERINHTDGDPEKLVYLSFNTMQENQLLNKELINALNRLFEERTNYSLEEQLIQFQQLQILCIHKDERQFIKIFIQVFEMSSKFWESNHVQRKADAQNLVVIWADAAGGLYGLLLGPVGSIVEAAVFSTIAAIQ